MGHTAAALAVGPCADRARGQRADGSVLVSEALRPHLGLDVLTPAR